MLTGDVVDSFAHVSSCPFLNKSISAVLFSGFFIPVEDIPVWLRWLQYRAFHKRTKAILLLASLFLALSPQQRLTLGPSILALGLPRGSELHSLRIHG